MRLVDRRASPAPRLPLPPAGSERSTFTAQVSAAPQAPAPSDPLADSAQPHPIDASAALPHARLTALIQAQRASIDNAARLAGTPSVTGANAGLPLSVAARAPAEIIEALAAASAASAADPGDEPLAGHMAGPSAGLIAGSAAQSVRHAEADAENAHDLLALLAETRSQAMAQATRAPAALQHGDDEDRDERPPMIIERAQVEQLRTGPISTPLPMPVERRPVWPGLVGGAALSMLAGLAFFLWLPPA